MNEQEAQGQALRARPAAAGLRTAGARVLADRDRVGGAELRQRRAEHRLARSPRDTERRADCPQRRRSARCGLRDRRLLRVRGRLLQRRRDTAGGPLAPNRAAVREPRPPRRELRPGARLRAAVRRARDDFRRLQRPEQLLDGARRARGSTRSSGRCTTRTTWRGSPACRSRGSRGWSTTRSVTSATRRCGASSRGDVARAGRGASGRTGAWRSACEGGSPRRRTSR